MDDNTRTRSGDAALAGDETMQIGSGGAAMTTQDPNAQSYTRHLARERRDKLRQCSLDFAIRHYKTDGQGAVEDAKVLKTAGEFFEFLSKGDTDVPAAPSA